MVAFLISSCYSERFYEGDGNLKDSGFWVIMGDRYILSLKEVDLSKNGIYEFSLENLPPNYTFTVGLAFEDSIETLRASQTKVRMELSRDGKDVISTKPMKLYDWTLSYSPGMGFNGVYAYQRGELSETALDCARGTYFVPKHRAKYRLILTVEPAAGDDIQYARLILSDAGRTSVDCA